MTAVVIALGSNLGDRLANLRAAVRLLGDEGVTVLARSSVWETPPVPPGQPRFLNAVVTAETELGPLELLSALKRIEHALGRRPSRHWGPRPADLDILLYGDDALSLPGLEVPHPRLAERAFVLVPLAEVVEGALPVLGQSALELLAALPPEPLRRVAGL